MLGPRSRRGLAAALARVLLVAGVLGCVTLGPVTGTARLDGRLIDDDTGEPVEGAMVFAIFSVADYLDFGGAHPRNLPSTVLFSRTDREGRFVIPTEYAVHRPMLCATTEPYPYLRVYHPDYGPGPELRGGLPRIFRASGTRGFAVGIRPQRRLEPGELEKIIWRSAHSCYWATRVCAERCRAMIGDRAVCQSDRWPVALLTPMPADFHPPR